MMRSVRDVLRDAASALADAGIDDARAEAMFLLAHCLGTDRIGLKRDPARLIDDAVFSSLLTRRLAREPMAFLTGMQGFWTLDLGVSPATLIPRADSETLIEAAIKIFPDPAAVRTILDLGTGTGCLLLAALAVFPQAFGIGGDLNPDCGALAARNAAANGLRDRAAFFCGRWAASLAGRFDLILSNPPYIPSDDIATLMPEVERHEPRLALDGGADGLDAYRILLNAAPALLQPGGVLILELGVGQRAPVADLARQAGFATPDCLADAGGIDRALIVRGEILRAVDHTAGE